MFYTQTACRPSATAALNCRRSDVAHTSASHSAAQARCRALPPRRSRLLHETVLRTRTNQRTPACSRSSKMAVESPAPYCFHGHSLFVHRCTEPSASCQGLAAPRGSVSGRDARSSCVSGEKRGRRVGSAGSFWSAAACRRFGKREQAPALHKPVAAHRPSPRLRPRPTVLRIKHALDSRTPATCRLRFERSRG